MARDSRVKRAGYISKNNLGSFVSGGYYVVRCLFFYYRHLIVDRTLFCIFSNGWHICEELQNTESLHGIVQQKHDASNIYCILGYKQIWHKRNMSAINIVCSFVNLDHQFWPNRSATYMRLFHQHKFNYFLEEVLRTQYEKKKKTLALYSSTIDLHMI